jgi:dTDP-glucose 4,6-dehydratase
MKHIIFGGDGFLGTELTKKLSAQGEQVLVCDRKQTLSSGIYDSPLVSYIKMDVKNTGTFTDIPTDKDDVVYHFAAELLVPILKRKERKQYFWDALYVGTVNVFNFMQDRGLNKLVYYTTDMVYGHTFFDPRFEDHPRVPIGPYGEAKYQTELLCEDYRKKGFNITIFRPRLIIGEGRLGILEKLFQLIDHNLPVPMIGNGKNYYQFISVSDCADACIRAVEKGFPNEEFNVGSLNPPTVRELLSDLIKEANSKSFLIPTPAPLVKMTLAALDVIGKPIMDPEQYLIADETCVLEMSKVKEELDWQPKDTDSDLLIIAYKSYREKLEAEKK